jgi:hypothetical protein
MQEIYKKLIPLIICDTLVHDREGKRDTLRLSLKNTSICPSMSLAKDLVHWVSFVEGDSSGKTFQQGEALQTCEIFYKSLKLFSRLYARVIAENILDQAQQKLGRNDFFKEGSGKARVSLSRVTSI